MATTSDQAYYGVSQEPHGQDGHSGQTAGGTMQSVQNMGHQAMDAIKPAWDSMLHSMPEFGRKNVGPGERVASLAGGTALAVGGLAKGGLGGIAAAVVGASLLYRGATGHCGVYEAIGADTSGERQDGTPGARAALDGQRGTRVEESVTINRPAAELYAYWRDFSNLPRIMSHLESVTVTDPTHSRWVAKAPAGTTVSWDAEVITDTEGELISWASLPGSAVDNAGSVRFTAEPHGRGTQLKVTLAYVPPAGKLGALVAKLFMQDPKTQIHADLTKFKRLMETGEVPTVKGQSSGRG